MIKGKKALSAVLILCMMFALLPTIKAGAAAPTYTVSPEYAAGSYYSALSSVTLTGNQRNDIVNVALSQVGYHEGNSTADLGGGNTSGSNNYTEYCKWYGSYTAWCAVFISWCARQAQIPSAVIRTNGAADCDDFGCAWQGRDAGRTVEISYTPSPGDIIVFDTGSDGYCTKSPASNYGDHVGIVTSVSSGRVYTVEGNRDDDVQTYSYLLSDSDIKGYAVPYYTNTSAPGVTPTLTVSGQTVPTALSVGESFGLRGIVSTNYGNLTSVTGSILNAAGNTVSTVNVTPNAAAYNLRNEINNGLIFNTLPQGSYTYRVTATADNGGATATTTLINQQFSVGSQSTYTVTYDANGGTGAPAAQTKTAGTTLTLSSTAPTRGGYTFLGWATTSTAGTAQYKQGDSYTADANLTLYAVWQQNSGADQSTVTVGTKTAKAGDTVSVAINLGNNPGIASLSLNIDYDAARLDFVSAAFAGAYSANGSCNKTADGSLKAIWYNGASNTADSGTFLTLTFTVKSGAATGEAPVTIAEYVSQNYNEQDVSFLMVNGGVTVVKFAPGDINGDGFVDVRDVLRLAKYVSGVSVELNASADVTGDGTIDVRDVLRLAKFVSGVSVELH